MSGSSFRDTTISGTDIDVRDLTSVSDSVEVKQATASNLKIDLSGTAVNTTAIKVDGSAVTQPVSLATAPTTPVTGTFWQVTQPISAATLPLPTGASALSEQQTQTTALQLIDNFISGSRGLVTEDNSAAIKTAVETIDNAISGSEMQVDIVSEAAPTTLVAFVTDIPTAGSRVQLATNTIVAGVLQAPSTNTGNVFIGGSTVSSTVFGAELQPGQSVGIAISNTNKIYIDAATNGDDVAFLGS